MAQDNQFYEAMERVDGHVFVGDALHRARNRVQFRKMLERWERELDVIDKIHASEITHDSNLEVR